MMKSVVALCALVLMVHSTHAIASLRTVRRVPAVVEAVAPVAPAANAEKVEMVMAEIRSEADSISEDGSNDATTVDAAKADAEVETETETETETADANSESDSIHSHFRQFTTPMSFLPNDHTTLVEVESAAKEDDDAAGDAGKGSNPTYILPVDPFNYFPFFNGFSNVNPFSQFYPPAPYLYPQYTNYMHQYANYGAGRPPAYPYPGQYGAAAHTGFPYNYPHPAPHMHYPFGAYKMDVSGPDVRTGSNNPPPFPQFSEISSSVKLIRPEIIPKAELESEAVLDSDVEEEGDEVIASFIELSNQSESEAEAEAEVDAEDESEDDTSMDVEFEDESDSESGEAEDVEMLDESSEEELTSEGVEFEEEEGTEASDEVEYIAL